MKRRTKSGRLAVTARQSALSRSRRKKKSKRATTTQKKGRASNNRRVGGSVVAAAVGIGSILGLGVAFANDIEESDSSSHQHQQQQQQQQAIVEGTYAAADDATTTTTSLADNNTTSLADLVTIMVGDTIHDDDAIVAEHDARYVVQEGIDYFEKCISHVADVDNVMPRFEMYKSFHRVPPYFDDNADDHYLQFKLRSIYAVTYICFHRILQKYVDVFIAPANDAAAAAAAAAAADDDLNVIKKLVSDFLYEKFGQYQNITLALQQQDDIKPSTYDNYFKIVYTALNSKCKSLILQCLMHLRNTGNNQHIMKFFACVRTFFKDVMSIKRTSLNAKEEIADKPTMAKNLSSKLCSYYQGTILKNINNIQASSCSGFPGSPYSLSSEFAKYLFEDKLFPNDLKSAINKFTSPSSSSSQEEVVGGGRKKVEIRVQRGRAAPRRIIITRGRRVARTRTCRSVVDA